ncbi:MAG: hypothetical protein D3910_11245, partial [Candidatus Electrothrix sp. ATG2]|nr:hypothetical protein [Candidatus Electrothrix sp. ATG2]
RKWGNFGTGEGKFKYPVDIDIHDNGRVYVSDAANHRIQVFDKEGNYIDQWGGFGTDSGEFNIPHGVKTDINGNVFISDGYNYRVQIFTADGEYLSQFGSYGSGKGQFNLPNSMAIDSHGAIYVTEGERTNPRIQKFINKVVLDAIVAINPESINLKSKGKSITVYIELPEGQDVEKIVVDSIVMENETGMSITIQEDRPTAVDDYDEDGMLDLMVKFDRSEVHRLLDDGNFSLVVRGSLLTDNVTFTGSQAIKVTNN